jgi:2-desacetyl-2-hydroxyethyl bacteriochlorophyllide A dehydrogenase
MKAIQLERPQDLRFIDLPEPAKPTGDEVLLSVRSIGICGTDYSGYLGKFPFYSYPRIPGHELGVEVIAVGPEVTNVAPGDYCAVEPYMNCQRCYACRRGNTNCCEQLKTLGVMCDGGMRERMILPARKLHVSRKLTFEQMALVETLAIGCHAVNRGGAQPGENVVIIGAGPIGLSVIEFVKVAGAKSIVVDVNEQRLSFCQEILGVNHTILLRDSQSALKQLEDLTEGHLAELVIDATGNNSSMGNALSYVAAAGRLVFVGITQQEITFAHRVMHLREMTLLASRNALPADFDRIIKLIEEGQINTQPWVTHHTSFAGIAEDFPNFLKPETRVIKAMINV